jgi:hypothetical protein
MTPAPILINGKGGSQDLAKRPIPIRVGILINGSAIRTPRKALTT